MLVDKSAEFSCQNVLVTGGCGFIGCWFIELYLKRIAEQKSQSTVVCIDNLTYSGNLNNISHHFDNPQFFFVKGNICDYGLLKEIIEKNNITQIINFAAESCVDRSFHNPLLFSQSNIIGSQTLLEVYRNEFLDQIASFIHISTDEVYGEQLSHEESVFENNRLNPTNPYSASKAAIDLIINSYIYSYRLPIKIVRMNNVYGPRQYPEKIIPNFAMSLIKGEKLNLFGDGSHTRKYLFVKDAINAIFFVISKGNASETYNVGTHFEMANIDLTKKIIDFYHKDAKDEVRAYENYISLTKDRLYDDSRYDINFAKLIHLGWEEKMNFDKGLRLTIDWYSQNGIDWFK